MVDRERGLATRDLADVARDRAPDVVVVRVADLRELSAELLALRARVDLVADLVLRVQQRLHAARAEVQRAAPFAARVVREPAIAIDRPVGDSGVVNGFLHLREDLVGAFLLRQVAHTVGHVRVSLRGLVLCERRLCGEQTDASLERDCPMHRSSHSLSPCGRALAGPVAAHAV